MTMSRAIVQDGFDTKDPLSKLKLVTRPVPKALPGQVVVHITLRPVNPTDLINLRGGQGKNDLLTDGKGCVGSEGFGIVHQVGEGVTKVKTGQRVVPVTGLEAFKGNGSWQEYICLPEDLVWPVPDYLSDETAAQFVINPWTSYGMLKDLAVPAGEYILQSAAGSALGKQVIKLAKHWGVKTINVVRRAEQKAELRALGADEVICSSEEDIVARVKEITGGRGAYAALDAVSGAMTEAFVASLRDEGRVYVYGLLGGDGFRYASAHLFRGVHVDSWIIYKEIMTSHAKSEKTATEVAELLRDGIFEAAEVEKFDLADFVVAIAKSEVVGKGKKILLSS